MIDREAMKLALDFLESGMPSDPYGMDKEQHQIAITALRQALEQSSDIESAVKKENEACAEIAYSMAYSEDEAEEIAKAIRERMK